MIQFLHTNNIIIYTGENISLSLSSVISELKFLTYKLQSLDNCFFSSLLINLDKWKFNDVPLNIIIIYWNWFFI